MPTKVTKKSKRKAQHQKAIQGFKDWREKHLDAPLRKQVEIFDQLVDSAELEEVLNG